jgi:hypothetical protein
MLVSGGHRSERTDLQSDRSEAGDDGLPPALRPPAVAVAAADRHF